MTMLILGCIWIVMSGPVVSALIPLSIAILAVIPLSVSVSVFVFVCASIAFRRPLASVVMVPVFPFAPVFFLLGALSLSLFSGERFLKVVQAVHVGYGAEQDKARSALWRANVMPRLRCWCGNQVTSFLHVEHVEKSQAMGMERARYM